MLVIVRGTWLCALFHAMLVAARVNVGSALNQLNILHRTLLNLCERNGTSFLNLSTVTYLKMTDLTMTGILLTNHVVSPSIVKVHYQTVVHTLTCLYSTLTNSCAHANLSL